MAVSPGKRQEPARTQGAAGCSKETYAALGLEPSSTSELRGGILQDALGLRARGARSESAGPVCRSGGGRTQGAPRRCERAGPGSEADSERGVLGAGVGVGGDRAEPPSIARRRASPRPASPPALSALLRPPAAQQGGCARVLLIPGPAAAAVGIPSALRLGRARQSHACPVHKPPLPFPPPRSSVEAHGGVRLGGWGPGRCRHKLELQAPGRTQKVTPPLQGRAEVLAPSEVPARPPLSHAQRAWQRPPAF